MLEALLYAPLSRSHDRSAILAVALMILGIVVVVWGVLGWLQYRIGKRLDYPHSWLAWVPVGNVWMIAEMSGKANPILWFVGILLLSFGSRYTVYIDAKSIRILISLVASVALIVIYVLLWVAIAERRGKPSWWGVLYIVPIANIVIMVMLGNKDKLAVYPPQGYYYPQGYYPPPGYPQQPYPAQGYPGQPYPPQGYPQQSDPTQPYPPQYPQQPDPTQPNPPGNPEPGPDTPPPPPPSKGWL
jgi:hypothetical protein